MAAGKGEGERKLGGRGEGVLGGESWTWKESGYILAHPASSAYGGGGPLGAATDLVEKSPFPHILNWKFGLVFGTKGSSNKYLFVFFFKLKQPFYVSDTVLSALHV